VPAGEIWVAQVASMRNNTRITGQTEIYVTGNGGAKIHLAVSASLARFFPLVITGQFTLAEGDRFIMYMAGTNASDVIEGGVMGFIVDIEQ